MSWRSNLSLNRVPHHRETLHPLSIRLLWSLQHWDEQEFSLKLFPIFKVPHIPFGVVPLWKFLAFRLKKFPIFKVPCIPLCYWKLQEFILGLTLVFLNTRCHLINFSFSCFVILVERLTRFQLFIFSVHVNSTNMHNLWFNSVPSDFYLGTKGLWKQTNLSINSM